MTTKTFWLVRGKDGEPISYTKHQSLRDAVLEAARDGGHGACFQRDEQGNMAFYRSKYPAGNNPYYPLTSHAYMYRSSLVDDDEAEEETANKLLSYRTLYFYFGAEIERLTYDGDTLTHIDGKALHEIADDENVTVESLQKAYA